MWYWVYNDKIYIIIIDINNIAKLFNEQVNRCFFFNLKTPKTIIISYNKIIIKSKQIKLQ